MRPISTKGSCLAVILASAFGSGCLSFPGVYGETWAAPVQLEGETCPNIDGDYQNAGEKYDSDTYARTDVSLAYLLGSHAEQRNDNSLAYTFENPAKDAYQSVSLKREADSLQVVASRADGSQRAFELPASKECHDSMLQLGAAWDSGTMLVASMVGRSKLALGRAEDGSLLVYQKDSGVGLLFYMPIVAGTSQEWIMFPLVGPEQLQQQEQLRAATP
jgi:hypothetical protein